MPHSIVPNSTMKISITLGCYSISQRYFEGNAQYITNFHVNAANAKRIYRFMMIFIGGRNLALSILCNIIPPVGLLYFTSKFI